MHYRILEVNTLLQLAFPFSLLFAFFHSIIKKPNSNQGKFDSSYNKCIIWLQHQFNLLMDSPLSIVICNNCKRQCVQSRNYCWKSSKQRWKFMFRIDFNTLINVQERKKLQGAYKPNIKYTNKKNIYTLLLLIKYSMI